MKLFDDQSACGTTIYRNFAAPHPLEGDGILMGGVFQIHTPQMKAEWPVTQGQS